MNQIPAPLDSEGIPSELRGIGDEPLASQTPKETRGIGQFNLRHLFAITAIATIPILLFKYREHFPSWPFLAFSALWLFAGVGVISTPFIKAGRRTRLSEKGARTYGLVVRLGKSHVIRYRANNSVFEINASLSNEYSVGTVLPILYDSNRPDHAAIDVECNSTNCLHITIGLILIGIGLAAACAAMQ